MITLMIEIKYLLFPFFHENLNINPIFEKNLFKPWRFFFSFIYYPLVIDVVG